MSKHELQIVVAEVEQQVRDGTVAVTCPALRLEDGLVDRQRPPVCMWRLHRRSASDSVRALQSPHSSMRATATRLLITFSVVSLVTCRDLAMMAATLANMGRNPRTGLPVFDILGSSLLQLVL
jgi:glutaminase